MKASFASSLGVMAVALVLAAAPASAQETEGKVQIKGFVTGVLPDGGIDTVNTDLIGLPAGSDTRATDTFMPTVAVEYFVSPNFSIEWAYSQNTLGVFPMSFLAVNANALGLHGRCPHTPRLSSETNPFLH